jgi:hypothetical protein
MWFLAGQCMCAQGLDDSRRLEVSLCSAAEHCIGVCYAFH